MDPTLSEEALEVVMPLRDVFAQGAREARERSKAAAMKRRVILSFVVAMVAVGVVRLVRSKKK